MTTWLCTECRRTNDMKVTSYYDADFVGRIKLKKKST